MIAIKTTIKELPEYCDDCQWFGTRPHPYKGWTDICELCAHSMDDDDEEEWRYGGNCKPKMCPLIEVKEDAYKYKWHDLKENPQDLPEEHHFIIDYSYSDNVLVMTDDWHAPIVAYINLTTNEWFNPIEELTIEECNLGSVVAWKYIEKMKG